MKVNFSDVELVDLDDNPLPFGDGRTLTFRVAVCHALTSNLPGDEQEDGAAKHNCYKLALKIKKATTPMDVKVEDLVVIKKRVTKAFAPLVVGAIFDLIEGVEEPKGEA